MSLTSCTEEDLAYFLSNQNLLASNNIDKDTTLDVERVSASEPIGMINHGSTCYFNSVLQSLSNLVPFCTNFPSTYSEVEGKQVYNEIFKHLTEYYHSKKNLINPKGLLDSFGYTPQQLSEQQDAHEFLTTLLSKLDNMEKIFYGKCSDSVQCSECNGVSSQEATFQSISLDIPDNFEQENKEEKFSLLKLLQGLTAEEVLDNPTDLYECQPCGKKTVSKKKSSYTELPPVLSLHLKRFRFDPTNRRRRKLSTLIDTPETLNLDFLLPEGAQGTEYELSSVICHFGTPSSGHYKSYVYYGAEKQWYDCNDERIKKLSETEKEYLFNSLIQENSYVLFYTKKGSSEGGFETLKNHFQVTQEVEEMNKNFLVLNRLKQIQRSIVKIDTKTSLTANADASDASVFLSDTHIKSSYYLKSLTISELTDQIYDEYVKSGHLDGSKVSRAQVRLHRVTSTILLKKNEEGEEGETFEGEGDAPEADADVDQEFPLDSYEGETFGYDDKASLKLSELNLASSEKFLLEVNLASSFEEFNPYYLKFFAYKWQGLDDYLAKAKVKNDSSNDSNKYFTEESDSQAITLESLAAKPWQLLTVPFNKDRMKIETLYNYIKKKFSLDYVSLVHYDSRLRQLNHLVPDKNSTIFFNNYTRIIVETETNEAYMSLKNHFSIMKLYLSNPLDQLSESDRALALAENTNTNLAFTDADLAVLTEADLAAMDTTFDPTKIYSLRVSNNITLLELKQTIASKFCLKNSNNIIIKKNNTKSSSLLVNNQKTLKELDLTDHCFLFLEYSIKDFNSNEILLRFEINIENLFENISQAEAKKLLKEMDGVEVTTEESAEESVVETDGAVAKKKNNVTYLLLGELFFSENVTIFNIKKHIFEQWDTLVQGVRRSLLTLGKKYNDFAPKSPNHLRLKDLKPGKITSPLRNDRYLSRSLFGLVNGRRLVLDVLQEEEVISNNNLFFYLVLVSYTKKRLVKKNYLSVVIKKNYTLAELHGLILKKFPFLADAAALNGTNFNTWQAPTDDAEASPVSEADSPIEFTKGFLSGPALSFANLNKLSWGVDGNGLLSLSDGSLIVVRNKAEYKSGAAEESQGGPQTPVKGGKAVGLSGIRNMIKANRAKNKDQEQGDILILHKEDKPPLPDNAQPPEITELPVPSPTK